jgi:DNA-binding IclR family transcriptional regulator
MEQPYFLINSVTRTLDIIEYLSKRGEASVSEVSNYLGINMSTAHRFLASIKYFGYAEQNSSNQKYKLSLKVFEVGNRVIEKLDLRDIAKPFMYELADKTGETINLGIIDKFNIVYIDKVLSKNVLRLDSPIGGRDKIHATALGKAMMAFYSMDFIERYINEIGLSKVTDNTIVNKEQFIHELEKIKRVGYAIDSEETLIGLKCIAAPIFNRENKPIASISISGIKNRVNNENLEEYKEIILATSKDLSNQLGSAISI